MKLNKILQFIKDSLQLLNSTEIKILGNHNCGIVTNYETQTKSELFGAVTRAVTHGSSIHPGIKQSGWIYFLSDQIRRMQKLP